MTDKPQKKRDDAQEPTEDSKKEDYIDDAHPNQDREDALVDEQIDETFPASDPPANY